MAQAASPSTLPAALSSPTKESTTEAFSSGENGFEQSDSANGSEYCPQKSRKLKDQDTPKRDRLTSTLRSLMPSPVNHAARKKKADARMKKLVREYFMIARLKPEIRETLVEREE